VVSQVQISAATLDPSSRKEAKGKKKAKIENLITGKIDFHKEFIEEQINNIQADLEDFLHMPSLYSFFTGLVRIPRPSTSASIKSPGLR
jgi:hypothetical protein